MIIIILESHSPIFFGQTALTILFGHYGFDRLEPLVWELLRRFTAFFQQNVEKNTVSPRVGLRESCYGFLRLFSNKILKKYGFATGRTAMFFDLTIFFGHYG